MSYLIAADFNRTIQDANLQQIISSDSSILEGAVLTAEATAKSYLRQRFDLSQEFKNTNAWVNTTTYKASDRVTQSNLIYYAIYPFNPFDYSALYNIGDKVFWKDKAYTCKIQTPVLDHETGLQFRRIENIPLANVAPDDPVNGLDYWGIGTPYSVPAGTAVTNTTYWVQGDNRDQEMVMRLIDIALFNLHSRIAPRNIPDLRVKRHDDAMQWLNDCKNGEITPALPFLQPKQGNRIRFGGNVKNINAY